MQSPLLIGCDLTTASYDILSILGNEEVVAVNQGEWRNRTGPLAAQTARFCFCKMSRTMAPRFLEPQKLTWPFLIPIVQRSSTMWHARHHQVAPAFTSSSSPSFLPFWLLCVLMAPLQMLWASRAGELLADQLIKYSPDHSRANEWSLLSSTPALWRE